MLNAVAVRIQHDALPDLTPDRQDGATVLDHVRNVQLFPRVAGVMKLQRSVVVEPTPATDQSALQRVQPGPDFPAPLPGPLGLALRTLLAPVDLVANDLANLEIRLVPGAAATPAPPERL